MTNPVDFPITGGAKERISANTGRLMAYVWERPGVKVEDAFKVACAIERLVLTVRHAPSDKDAPL